MGNIRVRIAPSPTGFAHVGTGYTALFNYAFARHNKGSFIVRIEDTDVKRNLKDAEKAIFEGLNWIGLTWDEGADKGGDYGPYRPSEKLHSYQEKAKEMVKNGLAYEDDGAIRFKNPGEDVSWDDLVRGKITFPGGEITDFVILKSDGFPTYNFGVVIDDIFMKISHVIRGEEHISNTPRQLALYKAFDMTPPFFAHHVTLRGADRKKLSKRKDPVNLKLYKEQGYLPEALVNFLLNLGWSHPEGKEIFDLKEFVDLFDIKRLRKAGPVFDVAKLDWINGEYIRNLSSGEFLKRVWEFIPGSWDKELVEKIAPLVKERIKKLSEFEIYAKPFFETPAPKHELLKDNFKEHFEKTLSALTNLKSWSREEIDSALLQVADGNKYHRGDYFMNLRVAIFSSPVTVPINDSLPILGKEEVLKRIKNYLK